MNRVLLVILILALVLILACGPEQKRLLENQALYPGLNEIVLPATERSTLGIRAYGQTHGTYINMILVDENTKEILDQDEGRSRAMVWGNLDTSHKSTITIFSDNDLRSAVYDIYDHVSSP